MQSSNQSQNNTIDQHMDFIPSKYKFLQHQPYGSAYFQDHCQQQYIIQRAFQANNFTTIRQHIPDKIKMGSILQQRRNKVQKLNEYQSIQRNKTASQKQQDKKNKIQRKKMEKIGQLGYFQLFPYQQSQYDKQHQQNVTQYIQSKRKQLNISHLDFRPSGIQKKMKYQNPFEFRERTENKSNLQNYIYPFHIPEYAIYYSRDTYDRFHECQLRDRVIQKSKRIAGNFIPAKSDKNLTQVNRSKSVEIVKQIQIYLKKYLKDIGFFIGMNKKDQIDILFQEDLYNNTRLQLVMSRLCQHQNLSKYILRRNLKKWGRISESKYLQYGILPPWVKDPQQTLSRTQPIY